MKIVRKQMWETRGILIIVTDAVLPMQMLCLVTHVLARKGDLVGQVASCLVFFLSLMLTIGWTSMIYVLAQIQ